MATAKQLLSLARNEIGVSESPPASNRVKYNTWYYGREVSGSAYPWCMVFVQWVFAQAGVPLPVRTASCTALKTAAKNADSWVTSGYQPGDVVIYDWTGDGVMDHCGIVESVSGACVVAIEGNTSAGDNSNGGQVQRRTRTTSQINGAFRPTYDKEEPVMDNTPAAAHKEGVAWCKEQGIVRGDANGDLRLSDRVTRQELCTMLYRFYGLISR